MGVEGVGHSTKFYSWRVRPDVQTRGGVGGGGEKQSL